jgi:hypothetical protein
LTGRGHHHGECPIRRALLFPSLRSPFPSLFFFAFLFCEQDDNPSSFFRCTPTRRTSSTGLEEGPSHKTLDCLSGEADIVVSSGNGKNPGVREKDSTQGGEFMPYTARPNRWCWPDVDLQTGSKSDKKAVGSVWNFQIPHLSEASKCETAPEVPFQPHVPGSCFAA